LVGRKVLGSGAEEAFHFHGGVARVSSRLAKILGDLKKLPPDTIIVVEGAHDVAALMAAGIHRNHILTAAGKPIAALVEEVHSHGFKNVIDLLDGDRTGREISSALYRHAGKLRVNNRLKRVIFSELSSSKLEDLLDYLLRRSAKVTRQT